MNMEYSSILRVLCMVFLVSTCAEGAVAGDGARTRRDNKAQSYGNQLFELRSGAFSQNTSPKPKPKPILDIDLDYCTLPPYPENGRYVVTDNKDAVPGQNFTKFELKIICNPGLGVEDNRYVFSCKERAWSGTLPKKCVRYCKLNEHRSVEYRCGKVSYEEDVEDLAFTECGPIVSGAMVVRPVCRPNYYFPGSVLSKMHCTNGTWNYIAICKPECGIIPPAAPPVAVEGRTAKEGRLPWHVGVYSKLTSPYRQVCGGSLISTTAVISAAHCFWSESQGGTGMKSPASNFAVAVGKLYRGWNNPKDKDAQKSDVAEIKMTALYQGWVSNYQDDIAVATVVTPFKYGTFVRPVCINFGSDFDKHQMKPGTLGKVSGWGIGKPSPILKVAEIPITTIEVCRQSFPQDFKVYLTRDKICAGDNTKLCLGDNGGGLTVPEMDLLTERHFLRGVVSVSPTNSDHCTTGVPISFTQITKHQDFLREFL